MDKTQRFASLLDEIEAVVGRSLSRDSKLTEICRILKDGVPYYDWVGFYLVDPEAERELVLGPFVGEPTEHTRIGFGEGICGQAAELKETFVIQDVSQETNYLSCSPDVRSEIVLPIFQEGEIVGELDIDSHDLSPFSDEDERFLERVCQVAAQVIERG